MEPSPLRKFNEIAALVLHMPICGAAHVLVTQAGLARCMYNIRNPTGCPEYILAMNRHRLAQVSMTAEDGPRALLSRQVVWPAFIRGCGIMFAFHCMRGLDATRSVLCKVSESEKTERKKD